MRVADHDYVTPYRSNTRTCEATGCKLATRESKPYCPEHVGMNAHAMLVLQRIAEREAEDERVRKGKARVETYNIDGITAQEIVQNLYEHGPRTRERLCRELSIDREILDGYAQALITAKRVFIGRTVRGSETLILSKALS